MSSSKVTSKVGSSFPMRSLGWAGLAALVGCAACCAIPLLAVAGVGGGATAALAGLLWPGAEFVLGSLAFAGVLAVGALRRRALKKRSCTTSSSVGTSPEGGCACQPTGPGSAQIFATPSAPADQPIACTADLRNTGLIQAGLEGYRRAFTRLLATEPFPGGFRWRFRAEPGLDAEIKTLATAEHECCRFLTFNITADGPHIIWEVRAHDHAASFLEEYSKLPDRLRAEPRPGHDMIAVKDLATKAGLVFASEGKSEVR